MEKEEAVRLLLEEMERCQRAPELNGCEMKPEWQRTMDVCRVAIDAIREQEQRKWIPVTERMPDLIPRKVGTAYSEAVNILTSERKVMKAIWDGIDWTVLFDFGEAWGEEITHWTPVLLPLPEPPKEE